MKITSYLFSISILIFIADVIKLTNSQGLSYEDNQASVMKRLAYGQRYTEKITGGKVTFDYSEEKGVYCKAAEDLYEKEFVFKIPREFLFCSFEDFPYKEDFKKQIQKALIDSLGKNNEETKAKTGMYLFAFNLILIKHPQKVEIFEFLKKEKKSVPTYTEEVLEYIDSLPSVMYTTHSLSEKEMKFRNLIGLASEKVNELENVQKSVIKYVTGNLRQEEQKIILPWVSNTELLRYSMSIITSRTYKSSLNEYNILSNSTFDKKVDPDEYNICMIPFVDLCNHRVPKDKNAKDNVDFILIYKKNQVSLASGTSFKKGEDYEYSYGPNSPNDKLLHSYGFYVQDNPQSRAPIYFNIPKKNFSKLKHDISLKLKAIDIPFPELYTTNVASANVRFYLDPYEIHERVLRVIKLMLVSEEELKTNPHVYHRLKKNKWINYENEISSLGFYIQTIKNHFNQFPIKQEDVLYALHNTRQFYKENTESVVGNPKSRYIYRLRRKLLEVARENNRILIKNLQFAQDRMKNVLADQFSKLKHYYTSS